MKSRFSIPAIVLGLLLCGWTQVCRAQTASASPSTTEQQQQKLQKEVEQKALSLLDEIIKDTQAFKLAENRLRLRAIAAALLWKYDPQRARLIFKETIAAVIGMMNNDEDDDEPEGPHFLQGVAQLRRDIAQLLGPHDPRMARDFVRATRQPGAQTPDPYSGVENDVELELNLATQAAETDPKQALEIAEENLSKGYSNELMSTLTTLLEKDRQAAAKLMSDIIARLRSEDVRANQQAISLAFNLLQFVFPPENQSSSPANATTEPLLDSQGMHDLLDLNITLAVSAPNYAAYAGRLQMLEALMPQVQKYVPTRVAELRRKIAQVNRAEAREEQGDGDNPTTMDWQKFRNMVETGTADELLAQAAKVTPDAREYLYEAVVEKLVAQGETERAREIINSRVPDPALRKALLAQLDQQAALTAAEQGKIEQVRKSLAGMRTNEQRALALAELARAMAGKGEQKTARQLLIEAQGMINYRARNISQLKAQFVVAQAFLRVEPERSLTMLEAIVDQLNELISAAVTLGGFILEGEVMHDDEIRLEIITNIFPLFAGTYSTDLYTLASFDFDRTRALADRFQRDEARIVARLLLVQSVLGDRPAPESGGRQLRPTYAH